MIVPGLFGSAFGTYLMRQFFQTLPSDLEEAAILDGCSPWQIYWRILLPHARPAVMVLAVLTWVNVWNDFLWPLLMIQRNSLATLTLGLVRLRGEYVARWPVIMAASMLIMVPLVIIYAVAQRSFVRGIAVTGIEWVTVASVSFEQATRRYPGSDRPALDRPRSVRRRRRIRRPGRAFRVRQDDFAADGGRIGNAGRRMRPDRRP